MNGCTSPCTKVQLRANQRWTADFVEGERLKFMIASQLRHHRRTGGLGSRPGPVGSKRRAACRGLWCRTPMQSGSASDVLGVDQSPFTNQGCVVDSLRLVYDHVTAAR
jgi:hypothetical protein